MRSKALGFVPFMPYGYTANLQIPNIRDTGYGIRRGIRRLEHMVIIRIFNNEKLLSLARGNVIFFN
jgi:hypothetical protein